jgi:hypothetical protein
MTGRTRRFPTHVSVKVEVLSALVEMDMWLMGHTHSSGNGSSCKSDFYTRAGGSSAGVTNG